MTLQTIRHFATPVMPRNEILIQLTFGDWTYRMGRGTMGVCSVTFRPKIGAELSKKNTLAYVTRDGFPVTQYHTLIIPKRHTLDFFGLTQAELNAINALIHSQKKVIEGLDKTVEGFNIGANCGEIAGQSVWHCHIHLIPRRRGDVENPRGGVRHLIPGKGHY